MFVHPQVKPYEFETILMVEMDKYTISSSLWCSGN